MIKGQLLNIGVTPYWFWSKYNTPTFFDAIPRKFIFIDSRVFQQSHIQRLSN